MNRLMPGGEETWQQHFDPFMRRCTTFVSFIDWISKGPRPWRLCIEWPKGCDYWRWDIVSEVLNIYFLEEVRFDGCVFGLKSRAGGLMKKPWRVCTNDTNILNNFKPFVCSNTGSAMDWMFAGETPPST